jgi:hypothetical protein
MIVQNRRTKVNRKNKNVQAGWLGILEDAQSALREAVSRVRRIKKSIRVIQGKCAAGEPLPDYLEKHDGSTHI